MQSKAKQRTVRYRATGGVLYGFAPQDNGDVKYICRKRKRLKFWSELEKEHKVR